jgi:hypothetical protein
MSRPKGSKNKPKNKISDLIIEQSDANLPIKRGRGRPRKQIADDELVFAKNNTLLTCLFGNIKDLKREIRRLRKVKLACRAGTKERVELHRKIKELKQQLKNWKEQKATQPEENITITMKDKPSHIPILTEAEAKEKCKDDNGCMFFNICKKEKEIKGINVICFNPKYYIEKINRKCTQLDNTDLDK